MIGSKIKDLRLKYKMTQEELAKKLNTTQSLINRWENGDRNPSLKTLKSISTVFNVSLDILAFDKKEIEKLKIKDKNLLSKIKDLEKLSDDEKETVFKVIDSLLANKEK